MRPVHRLQSNFGYPSARSQYEALGLAGIPGVAELQPTIQQKIVGVKSPEELLDLFVAAQHAPAQPEFVLPWLRSDAGIAISMQSISFLGKHVDPKQDSRGLMAGSQGATADASIIAETSDAGQDLLQEPPAVPPAPAPAADQDATTNQCTQLLQELKQADSNTLPDSYWQQLQEALQGVAAAGKLEQLQLHELDDDAALLLCCRLITEQAAHTFCRALLSALLPQRLLGCQQALPRSAAAAVQEAAAVQGRAVVECVLLPLLLSAEYRAAHHQLVARLCKEVLQPPLRRVLLVDYVSQSTAGGPLTVNKSEAQFSTLLSLLDGLPDLSQADIDLVVGWWQRVVEQHPKSVNAVKVMLQIVTKHRQHVKAHAGAISASLAKTSTMLTKAVEAKLAALA